jgi:hypothetical protein
MKFLDGLVHENRDTLRGDVFPKLRHLVYIRSGTIIVTRGNGNSNTGYNGE